MSNLGIKTSLVNEITRKFETIARSNSSDSSNSNNGPGYAGRTKRYSNDNLEELANFGKNNNNQIVFKQTRQLNNFTIKQYEDGPKNNIDELNSDEINFTLKSTDSTKQSTVKRKNGLEYFKKDLNVKNNENESEQLRSEINQLRSQLMQTNDELLSFKKKYQEFQLEIETNEKIRNQQVDKLRNKVDYLLKMSFSNTFSKSVDEDCDQSEQIIKF